MSKSASIRLPTKAWSDSREPAVDNLHLLSQKKAIPKDPSTLSNTSNGRAGGFHEDSSPRLKNLPKGRATTLPSRSVMSPLQFIVTISHDLLYVQALEYFHTINPVAGSEDRDKRPLER